jgi:hypothetical protein
MLLPAISWPGGSPENTGIIIGVVIGAYVGALWLAAILWTIRDIRERSQDPVTQLIAVSIVMIFSLAGWVLYMVLRPGFTIAEVYDRQLEEESLLQDLQHQLACPQCGVEVNENFVACPHCATHLKELCHNCSRPLTLTWRMCPWCSSPRQSVPSLAAPSVQPLPARASVRTTPTAEAQSEAPPMPLPLETSAMPTTPVVATEPIPPLAVDSEPSPPDHAAAPAEPPQRKILRHPDAPAE